jgi:MFS family permease
MIAERIDLTRYVARLTRILVFLRESVMDFMRIGSVHSPLIRTNVGTSIIWVVTVVFSLSFVSLVDRQPSPRVVGNKIGDRPGFTFGKPESLLPYEATPNDLVGILLFIAVIFGVLYYSRRMVRHPTGPKSIFFGFSLAGVYFTAILFYVFEYLNYYTETRCMRVSWRLAEENPNHFYLLGTALLLQALALGVVLALYSRPLLPVAHISETADVEEEFDRHMQKSWKLTQMGLSAGIAVAVGVTLPVVVSKINISLMDTLLVIVCLLTVALATLLFPVLKIYYSERYRRRNITG